jgi:ERCC4-type nuclease
MPPSNSCMFALHSQAESMSKHYKCPCLLIEFDPEKTFELQSKHDLGGDIKIDSISSKVRYMLFYLNAKYKNSLSLFIVLQLALLAMHFPKLRVLWSRSPHETLKLFKKLKRYAKIPLLRVPCGIVTNFTFPHWSLILKGIIRKLMLRRQ